MRVRISKEKVFWNSTTDNKPSYENFEQFKASMQESDLQVNQDNFLNITIVASTRDITYIEIEHRDYTAYYYYNSIQKITNGGYVIAFKLDIWTTFTLPFLKTLTDKNIKLKAVRHHKLSKQSAYFTDEMKNSIPIMYSGVKTIYPKTTDYGYTDSGSNKVWKAKVSGGSDWHTNGVWIEITRPNPWNPDTDTRLVANGNIYFVFKINTSYDLPSYLVIPVFYLTAADTTIKFKNPHDIVVDWRDITVYNNFQTMMRLTSEANYMSQEAPHETDKSLSANFMGIYSLPSIFNLKTTLHGRIDTVKLYTGKTNDYTTYTVIALKTSIIGDLITKECNLVPDYFFDLIPHEEQVPSLNYTDKLHALVSDAMNLKWYNNIIKPSIFYEKGKGISFDKFIFGIGQEPFVKLFNDSGFNNDNVINFTNELPSFQDSYLAYLNQTKYTRDNQLNIFKQQAILSATKQIFSAVGSGFFSVGKTALGVKYGDNLAVGQGLRATIGTVNNLSFGLADTFLGYRNQVNTLKAQYADYANSTGNIVNSGSIEDILAARLNITEAPVNSIEKKELTKDTIASLNNIIYLYGNFNPIIDTLPNLQPRADFNYLELDKDYLQLIFNDHINTNVPIELYSHIIDTLSNGVRICKTNIPMSN